LGGYPIAMGVGESAFDPETDLGDPDTDFGVATLPVIATAAILSAESDLVELSRSGAPRTGWCVVS
jgi:hypothetical protein